MRRLEKRRQRERKDGKKEERARRKGAGRREIFGRKAGGSKLKVKEKRIRSSFPIKVPVLVAAQQVILNFFPYESLKCGQELRKTVCLRDYPFYCMLLVLYSLKLLSFVVCLGFYLCRWGEGIVFVSMMTEVSLLMVSPSFLLPCLGLKELINVLFRL